MTLSTEVRSSVSRPATRDRQDLAAGLAVILLVGLQAWLARDLWFYSDTWTYLFRDASTVEGLLRPHAGHLMAFPILTFDVLYQLAGLDYFPWYHLLRSATYAAFALAVWRYLRHRGVHPGVRWTVLLLVLVLAQQSWLMAYTFNNPMIHAVVLATLVLVDRHERPAAAVGVAVAGSLLVAVASGGSALAGITGLAAVAVARRRWSWLGPLLAPLVVYGVWYAFYAGGGRGGASVGALAQLPVELPKVALQVMSAAVGRTLAMGAEYWPVLGILTVVGLVLGVLRDRFSKVDLLPVVAMLTYLAMIVVARAGTGLASLTETRYTFNVSIWLILLVAPAVTRPRPRRVLFVAVPLVGVVLLSNVAQLREDVGDWSRTLSYSRTLVETAGALMDEGERFLPNAPIDGDRTAVVLAADLQGFLRKGWSPTAAQDDDVRARARAELKLAWSAREPGRGYAPKDAKELAGRDCRDIGPGDPFWGEVRDARTLVVKGAESGVVAIRWEDPEGPALRRVEAHRGTSYVRMIEPIGRAADLRVSVTAGGPVEVCNLPVESS